MISFVSAVYVQVTRDTLGPVLGTEFLLTCSIIGGSISGVNVDYQWQKNGENLTNENHQTLFFSSLHLSNAGLYTCIVSSETLSSRNHTDVVLESMYAKVSLQINIIVHCSLKYFKTLIYSLFQQFLKYQP